jgi:Na+-translocating ferredoxin:NAD+ oxidoreductase RnfC subunit
MSEGEIILRVDATYPLEVTDGDVVRGGEKIQEVPDTDEPIVAPVSGTIKSIHFDPARHEFIIAIAPRQ